MGDFNEKDKLSRKAIDLCRSTTCLDKAKDKDSIVIEKTVGAKIIELISMVTAIIFSAGVLWTSYNALQVQKQVKNLQEEAIEPEYNFIVSFKEIIDHVISDLSNYESHNKGDIKDSFRTGFKKRRNNYIIKDLEDSMNLAFSVAKTKNDNSPANLKKMEEDFGSIYGAIIPTKVGNKEQMNSNRDKFKEKTELLEECFSRPKNKYFVQSKIGENDVQNIKIIWKTVGPPFESEVGNYVLLVDMKILSNTFMKREIDKIIFNNPLSANIGCLENKR